MLEQISQSTSSYFSTINLVVYNFVCNQQAQYYLIQARKDNSPTTSTISYLENNLRQISYALPGCSLHLFIDNPSCPPIYMEDPSLIFTPGYHFKEDSWKFLSSSPLHNRSVLRSDKDKGKYWLPAWSVQTEPAYPKSDFLPSYTSYTCFLFNSKNDPLYHFLICKATK